MRSVALLVFAAVCAQAADVPMSLVSDDEAEPIRSAILRGEAWTIDAVRHLRADAERKMKEGPWTVVADRPKGLDLDPHEYYSEAPLWWPDPANPAGPYIRRDQPYPERFTANRVALNSLCDAVFTLGTAAFLLNNSSYASRAERLVQTWFVNPKTRMNPDMDFAQSIPGPTAPGRQQQAIPDGRPFIRAIQGMEFLGETGAWDPKDREAVRQWFEEYLRWLRHAAPEGSGPERAWSVAQEAAVATFVENPAVQRKTFAAYRERLLPREARSDAVAELEPLAILCRIAKARGVDLWDARTRTGATIASVVEALAPALGDPKKPPPEAGAIYGLALAGIGLNNPDYIALYHRAARVESAWSALIDLLVGRWEAAAHQTRH